MHITSSEYLNNEVHAHQVSTHEEKQGKVEQGWFDHTNCLKRCYEYHYCTTNHCGSRAVVESKLLCVKWVLRCGDVQTILVSKQLKDVNVMA